MQEYHQSKSTLRKKKKKKEKKTFKIEKGYGETQIGI